MKLGCGTVSRLFFKQMCENVVETSDTVISRHETRIGKLRKYTKSKRLLVMRIVHIEFLALAGSCDGTSISIFSQSLGED